MLVEKIVFMLGNSFSNDHCKVEVMIDLAVESIKVYLNNDRFTAEYIKENFGTAVILMVTNAYKGDKQNNIKQFTQGSKSVTYEKSYGYEITTEIRKLLPAPYIRLL